VGLGSRAGRGAGSTAPRLLLDLPDEPPSAALPTVWRCVVTGPEGDEGPERALAEARPSPMAGRGERALVTALSRDKLPELVELAGAGGDLGPVAELLLGLRQAGSDPLGASRSLIAVLDAGSPPWEHKLVRRLLPGLHICAVLAPGVPAVLPVGREAIALLVSELLTATGRHLDAAALLDNLDPTPAVVLALAAVHLACGNHEAAVDVTNRMANTDDVSALCLVARGVALRVGGRFDEALACLDQAMGDPDRHPGIIVAALGERADLLRLVGDDLAAQADIDRITVLEGGQPVGAHDPMLEHEDEPPVAADDPAMITAREWGRRRLNGMGTPGTFGGLHHRSYEADVEAMLSAGQSGTAEHLLLGLIDAVEDEADEHDLPIDPSYFLTLIDMLAHEKRPYEARAIRERLEDAIERHGEVGDPQPAPAITEESRARV
jgi:tetratricopeptide (TPR) repeat protein